MFNPAFHAAILNKPLIDCLQELTYRSTSFPLGVAIGSNNWRLYATTGAITVPPVTTWSQQVTTGPEVREKSGRENGDDVEGGKWECTKKQSKNNGFGIFCHGGALGELPPNATLFRKVPST